MSILAHNFLARKDRLVIDFYAHMKLYPALPRKKQQTLFNSKLKVNLRKKLAKCCIWRIVLYCAGNWTVRDIDQKYTENFEIWCWKMMANVSWTDQVRNEEELRKAKEEKNMLQTKYEERTPTRCNN